MPILPDIQLFLRSGLIEFGWGHPDPALLPGAAVGQAAAHAIARYGASALAYGAEQGPGQLIERLCARLAAQEGRAPDPAQLLITGGVSQALDLLCTLLTKPGDPILVEAPTYHLALRIFRDHGLELVPVPADSQGIRVDMAAATLELLRAKGRPARLLYTVPTFCNPTGVSMVAERRAALVALAAQSGLTILEDDVYRELWYETPPPPPLFQLGAPGPVIRLGSFAKLLAPGLRLGWMAAPAEVVRRCVGSGLLDSGGGVNHFTAMVVAALLEQDLLDSHVVALRAAYRRRRDILLAALARHLPGSCTWMPPWGGFFLWVCLPRGLDSTRLLAAAESAGVSYVPGPRFYAGGGGESYLRLSFALLGPQEMEEGARRLGGVIKAAGHR